MFVSIASHRKKRNRKNKISPVLLSLRTPINSSVEPFFPIPKIHLPQALSPSPPLSPIIKASSSPAFMPHSSSLDSSLDTLDSHFSSLSDTPHPSVASGRQSVSRQMQKALSPLSNVESLEERQLPTAYAPFPEEVLVIDDASDLAIEAAALRGQLTQTSENLTFASLLSGPQQEEVQQLIDAADTDLVFVEGLVGQAHDIETQEQTQQATIRDLQARLDTATQAATDAQHALDIALADKTATQTALDTLPGKIAAQQVVVTNARNADTQKAQEVQNLLAVYTTKRDIYISLNTAYTTAHDAYLVARTAYLKNTKDPTLKNRYDAALLADTQAKATRDAARVILDGTAAAYTAAVTDRKATYAAVAAAQQVYTDLSNQLRAAKIALPKNTAAVTTAQNALKAAQTSLHQAEQNLQVAQNKERALEDQLHAIVTDPHIAAAIDAVHASATVLQDDIAAAEEPLRFAESLSFSIQSSLEAEEEPIGYAKMFISIEPLEREVHFTVRYRVPNPHYIVEALMTNVYGSTQRLSSEEQTEPTSDASWSFNTGGALTMLFRIRDLDTGKILAVANARCNDNNTGYIDTLQTDFAYDEPGMLAENPIVPSLKIGKIQGTTMLLVVETPHDQYVVGSDMSGSLGTAIVSCPDGTTFGLSQITIDAGCATGNYPVFLFDRIGGQAIDTVMLHFDKPSHTLSLLDGTDQYIESSLDDTDAAQKLNAQQALQNVPIGLSDPTIATIQRLRLYSETQNLPAPYNLYVTYDSVMTALFALPENWRFAPENQAVAVQQLLESGGTYNDHGTIRYLMGGSQAQDSIVRGRQQRTQIYRDALGVYEQAMSECMQAAVNMYLGIIQGKPERPLKDTAQAVWQKWTQNGSVAMIGRLGFPLPSFFRILDSAKMIYQQNWGELVEAQEDVVRFKEREEYLQQQKEIEDAKKGFTNAGGDASIIPPTMSRREITLAANIRRTLDEMNDTRIASMNPIRKNMLAIRIAQSMESTSTNGQSTDISAVTEEVMNTDLSKLHAAAGILSGTVNGASIGISVPDFNKETDNNVSKPLALGPDTLFRQNFHLTENSMVNLTLTHDLGAFSDYGVSLSIYDVDKQKIQWTSDKDGISANTISASFPPGNYQVMVTTGKMGGSSASGVRDMNLHLNIDVEKQSTAKIEGMISLEGNAKAMPISMSLVAFNSQGTRTNINPDTGKELALDLNKPVWIIVHGRGDSDASDQMLELERNLSSFNNIQLVVIDWHQAAADNITQIGLQGSQWIKPTGSWIASQLMSMGMKKDNINLVGHSWGTYVSYEIGAHIPGGINTIIALDPAVDNKWLGGAYPIDDVNFTSVAAHSDAIHSSNFGDKKVALTAHNSFDIIAPENYEQSNMDATALSLALRQKYFIALGAEFLDEVLDAYHEHGFAVTLFSSLLKQGKNNGVDRIAALFTPINLSSAPDEFTIRDNDFEGTFEVDPIKSTYTVGANAGKNWWKAGNYHFYP